MDSALEPLDWDEQEAATIPSMARPALQGSVRKSSKGWLVITNEWPESQRDTVVSDGPSTERSSAPPASRSLPPPSSLAPTSAAHADELLVERSAPRSEAPASTIPRHSDIRALSVPIARVPDTVGERETRQRMSSVALEMLTEPLEAQIAQLRRWLMVSLSLSAVATVTAAVAVIYALGGPSVLPPFELPSMSPASPTMAVHPRVQSTRIRGHLAPTALAELPPVSATEDGDRAADDTGPAATSTSDDAAVDGKIDVVIALLAPRANVTLTQFGTNPRSLFGPWPQTLRLAPGRYTVTAYRPGSKLFQRQLDLDVTRPKREVAISFE